MDEELMEYKLEDEGRQAEARRSRSKVITCPRCEQQVSPEAWACPHCGFDFTVEPPIERVRKLKTEWLPTIRGTLPHLAVGAAIAGLFAISDILLGRGHPLAAVLWAAIVLLVALGNLARSLTLNGLTRISPVAGTAIALLSLSPSHL